MVFGKQEIKSCQIDTCLSAEFLRQSDSGVLHFGVRLQVYEGSFCHIGMKTFGIWLGSPVGNEFSVDCRHPQGSVPTGNICL